MSPEQENPVATNDAVAELEKLSAPVIEITEEERQQAKQDWERLGLMLNNFPPIKNFSQAKHVALALSGPLTRIWRKDNTIQIGFEKRSVQKAENGDEKWIAQRMLIGEGPSYRDALIKASLTVAQLKARAFQTGNGNGAGTQDEAGSQAVQTGGAAAGEVKEGPDDSSSVPGQVHVAAPGAEAAQASAEGS